MILIIQQLLKSGEQEDNKYFCTPGMYQLFQLTILKRESDLLYKISIQLIDLKMGKKKINNPDNEIQKLKNRGNQALENENFQKAINLYSQALEIKQTAILFSNRALTYLKLKNPQQALKDSLQAIKLDQKYLKPYLRAGQALIEMDRLQQSIDYFKLAKELQPQHPLTLELQQKIKKQVQIDKMNKNNPQVKLSDQLFDWLKKGGAIFPKIKIRYYSQNFRGVTASSFIRPQQQFFFIPNQLIITNDKVNQHKFCKEIRKKIKIGEGPMMASFILFQRINPQSFWKPYIQIFPHSFQSFPLFFTPQQLTYLQGTVILQQVKNKKKLQKMVYQNIKKSVAYYPFTFHDFQWAITAFQSRTFGFSQKGIKASGLVPLADMLNHKIPLETKWEYVQNRNGFRIFATQQIQRGNQIFDSYGLKGDDTFFVNYGFIPDDNTKKQFVRLINQYVTVDLQKSDPYLKAKQEIMRTHLTKKTFILTTNYLQQKCVQFLGFLKFMLLKDQHKIIFMTKTNLKENDKKVEQVEKDPRKKREKDKQKQIEQEKKGKGKQQIVEGDASHAPPQNYQQQTQMWNWILNYMNQALKGYKTTIQQDTQILKQKQNQLTFNMKNAIVLRQGQKRVIFYFIDLATKMLHLLKLKKKQVKKLMYQQQYKAYQVYIQTVILNLFIKE